MKKASLGKKIGAGFGLIIIVTAVLGFVSWRGVSKVQEQLKVYVGWGDIDMVMNEDVAQRCMRLDNALADYRAMPDEKGLKALSTALDKAEQGISEWYNLVKGHEKLRAVAEEVQAHLKGYRSLIAEYQAGVKIQGDIGRAWDKLVVDCLGLLEKTMEEVIDPAKEKANEAQDIPLMVKWGDIDMIMNEGVIANVLKLQTAAHDYSARSDEAGWKAFLGAHERAAEGLKEWRETLAGEAEMERTAAEIGSYLTKYRDLGEKYRKSADALRGSEKRLTASREEMAARLDNAMEKVIDPSKDSAVVKAESEQRIAAGLALWLSLGCVALGVIIALLITRSITGPVRRIIDVLNQGADQVSSASAEVSSSSQLLAEGSSEQAASIEETSASLEEMSSMTKQNADNARQADELMKEANNVVGRANNSMSQLTASMDEISKASEETSKIIKTIDEIAFQTNLLALNAAVEAARAGEAGAGFAVVADEVRNLAMRAAEAAKDTSALIEGTVKKVNGGGELVATTNEAFSEVSKSAAKVGELVGEIAAASSEQSQGVEQVNLAVTEMDKVVQQNAASAEESASAAEEMNAQAEQMKHVVGDLVGLVEGAKSSAYKASKGSPGTSRTGQKKAAAERGLVPGGPSPLELEEVGPGQVIPVDDSAFKDF